MLATKRIPLDQLTRHFDDFTKRFLRDDSPEAADVEILEPDWGDQHLAERARLLGITFDHKENALEFSFQGGQHRIFQPREVWTVEETDGFVDAIEVVHGDETREVVSIKRMGSRAVE